MQAVAQLREHVQSQLAGQEGLVLRLLIALLADGHLLVEGAPGLAKTTAIKALASGIEGDFHRIQFTPDLLPADLTGTEVYRPQDGDFQFQHGPIFHNLVLADEINRAPAKVQSALLEAMAERQVTVGRSTYALPKLFLVMATQNPIEQEGTYPLPEAQLDRFLMYVRVGYPSIAEEHRILALVRAQARSGAAPGRAPDEKPQRISQETVFAAREAVLDVHLAEALEEYLVAAGGSPHATRAPTAAILPSGCVTGRARAGPSRSSAARAPMPGCWGATTSAPRTCMPSPTRYCAIGCC